MKHTLKPLMMPFLAFMFVLCLNSCYFNSAGHIFDKASHQAVLYASDIKEGDKVYCSQDGNYYVELPRYRFDEPVTTWYPKKESDTIQLKKIEGETVMTRIPADYAMYLTGQAKSPQTPSSLTPSKLSAAEKQQCSQLTVTQTTTNEMLKASPNPAHIYQYRSPNAFGWYTLGVLDWLCVDLPITCTANGLTLGLAALELATEYQLEKNKADMERIRNSPAPTLRTCGACEGRGTVVGRGTCSNCGGSGRVRR